MESNNGRYQRSAVLCRLGIFTFALLLFLWPVSLQAAGGIKAFTVPRVATGQSVLFSRKPVNFCLSASVRPHAKEPKKYIFEKAKMGSPFTITIFTADSTAAAIAAAEAFLKTDELNGILSDYLAGSEINQLSATSGTGKYVSVSAPLYDILQRAVEAARFSGGRFDISIGPLVSLWRRARRTKMFPNLDSLRSARMKTNYKYIHLDTVNHTVCLERTGMKLDVGGLGKGFVAAAALEVLKKNGFFSAMVNAGGKIVTGQPPEGTGGWLIGINAPGDKEAILSQLLTLTEMSVATSGDLYQYMDYKGKRFSHIINPKTGNGLTVRRNVTAIAADATTADWLSTACSVLSPRKAFKLIRKIPGAALLITENKNGKIYRKSSPGFKKYCANLDQL